MGRIPCCEKDNVKRGQWTPEEDNKLSSYIAQHGTRNWRVIPKNAGLQRCGKSCRLRWTNYLRPDLKRGDFTGTEEQTIVKLHAVVGNRWSLIAAQLPGRTDNDVKNYWNTKLKKKLSGMGIDPVTHKPFSHLMAEIATTLAPPQVAHLAEAALGCFKDEMLHLLTKKRVDFTATGPSAAAGEADAAFIPMNTDDKEETIHKIQLGLSRAMREPVNVHDGLPGSKPRLLMGSRGDPSDGLMAVCKNYSTGIDGFGFGGPSFCNDGERSAWSQSLCTGSTCTGGAAAEPVVGSQLLQKMDDDDGEEAQGGKLERKDSDGLFGSDCGLWDLADDLMIH